MNATYLQEASAFTTFEAWSDAIHMLGWFPSGMRLTPNSSQPMVKIISYLWYAIINLASDCHQLEKLIYEMTLAIAIGGGMRDQYVEENHTTAINWLLENMPETNSGLSFISRFF